jgi:sulfoxide reductase heme-binding subunit YedZ
MSQALWLLGRGTGVATLVLLTASVVLGLLTAGGLVSRELPRFALTEIHRRASLGATVLLVLHLGSLWLDPVAQLRAVDLVVPFLGARNPMWWGLGTLAADLVAVLVVTSLLRRRMPHVVWRRLHWLSYGTWPLAFLHGLGSGTDAGTWWLRGMAAGCFVAVVSAAGYRLAGLDDVAPRRTIGGPAGNRVSAGPEARAPRPAAASSRPVVVSDSAAGSGRAGPSSPAVVRRRPGG